MALDSTDLFLNFAGYDAVNVSLNQILGTTDFVISDGSTSGTVDLFTFGLANTAGVPASFPANVILEDIAGDLSDPVGISVSMVVPEPADALLAVGGLLVICLVGKLRRCLAIVAAIAMVGMKSDAQVSAVQLVSSEPGITQGATTDPMLVAFPLLNGGTVTAMNVQVTSVFLKNAPLLSPTVFPVMVGNISPGSAGSFQASFNSSGLVQGTKYLLTVRGTYQVAGVTGGFTVNRFVLPGIPSPGSAPTHTVTINSGMVSGAPYPSHPLDDDFDSKVNTPGVPVTIGPYLAGTPSTTPTIALPMPPLTTAAGAKTSAFREPAAAVAPFFTTNSGLGLLTATLADGTGVPGFANRTAAEPSGDVSTDGTVILNSTNALLAFSTDSGTSWSVQNPGLIFPPDGIGFCCDQVVKYVQSIGEFVWLIQGDTGYRLAAATPAQVKTGFGTLWHYWNLTPPTFGQPAGTNWDYPAVSVGNIYLYLAWNVGTASCPAGCTKGRQVVRIPLSDIQGSGTIHMGSAFSSDLGALFANLSQDTADTVYWASTANSSSLTVYAWPETETTFGWMSVPIASWVPFDGYHSGVSSLTPDGQDWLTKARMSASSAALGAVRSGSNLWFAWTVAANQTFPQVHIEMVQLTSSRFDVQLVLQRQIFDTNIAYAYPSLAANCRGEIALSVEAGGANLYENHAVGFLNDSKVYLSTISNVGTTRYGDYTTIRPEYLSGYFNAWGYGLTSTANGPTAVDVHYVVFGHNLACDAN